ncbi:MULTISPECIES: hypothetical protein [unclassified Endozoicomonas]|uniref:hypothetical protein n=1 Tax=unclassified Endozoicomonas TaxID=2644528 RepID=UPI003BB6D318
MEKENDTKLRYFVFFYHLSNGMDSAFGNIWVKEAERFPSNKSICEQVTKTDDRFKPEHVIITGWQEMTEADFNDFERSD